MPERPSPVINSSPLIALVAALPDFGVLAKIVHKLIVPGEVLAELSAGGQKDSAAAAIAASSWCEVRPVLPPCATPTIHTLGRGESAVIQTALEARLPLVVIDEVRGRRAARLAGLTVIGSLGLLVELHRANLLASIEEAIRSMQRKGIYLAPHLVEATLLAASKARGL